MMGCGIVRIINGQPFYCTRHKCSGQLHYMRKLDAPMRPERELKSLSVILLCGCRCRILPDLGYKREKLCREHRLERWHIAADDATLDVSDNRPSERGHTP